MNSLHLCDTFVDGEREWMCTLQTGLQDNSLSKLTADSLPPKCSEQIDKLMLDLSEKIDERNETLTQLIETVLKSFEPKNRSEYLWYLQFTVVVLLLNDLPVSIYTLQGHLLTKCFSPSTSLWDSNPVKVDYFADHLYDIIENNKNLIFVTSQIENRSSLGFHLSLCMLWKSIYRCIDEEKSMFRLYPPTNLVALTTKIATKNLDTEFATIFDFIMLHSRIASLIFHRQRRTTYDTCNVEFFVYDVTVVKTLKDFLEKTLNKVETMFRRDNENLDYLMMIEYLQIDISEFDSLVRSLQK